MSWMVLGVLLCCCTLLSSQLWQWVWKGLQGCFSQHHAHLYESASGTLREPLLGGLHGGGDWQWLCVLSITLTSVWWWLGPATLQLDHGLGDLLGFILSSGFRQSVFDSLWLSQRFENLMLETKFLPVRQMEPHALANCNSDIRVLIYACRKFRHILYNSSNFRNYFHKGQNRTWCTVFITNDQIS